MLHYSDPFQTFGFHINPCQLSLSTATEQLDLRLKTVDALPLTVRNDGPHRVQQVEVALFMPKGLIYAGGSPKGWMCSQRQQILHCTSLVSLAPGEFLELLVPLAPTYRILEGGLGRIEVRFINHPGAEFDESLWVDVAVVVPRVEA